MQERRSDINAPVAHAAGAARAAVGAGNSALALGQAAELGGAQALQLNTRRAATTARNVRRRGDANKQARAAVLGKGCPHATSCAAMHTQTYTLEGLVAVTAGGALGGLGDVAGDKLASCVAETAHTNAREQPYRYDSTQQFA